MTKPITKIVVLGGGTAGWLSAGLLAAEHPHLDVTLVESANVPILGVGEGTWPSMRNTLQRIGIKESDFITQCDASFKQGSKFINWRNLSEGENYYHPFMNPQGYDGLVYTSDAAEDLLSVTLGALRYMTRTYNYTTNS